MLYILLYAAKNQYTVHMHYEHKYKKVTWHDDLNWQDVGHPCLTPFCDHMMNLCAVLCDGDLPMNTTAHVWPNACITQTKGQPFEGEIFLFQFIYFF